MDTMETILSEPECKPFARKYNFLLYSKHFHFEWDAKWTVILEWNRTSVYMCVCVCAYVFWMDDCFLLSCHVQWNREILLFLDLFASIIHIFINTTRYGIRWTCSSSIRTGRFRGNRNQLTFIYTFQMVFASLRCVSNRIQILVWNEMFCRNDLCQCLFIFLNCVYFLLAEEKKQTH